MINVIIFISKTQVTLIVTLNFSPKSILITKINGLCVAKNQLNIFSLLCEKFIIYTCTHTLFKKIPYAHIF